MDRNQNIHNEIAKLARLFETTHVLSQPYNRRLKHDWDELAISLSDLISQYNDLIRKP